MQNHTFYITHYPNSFNYQNYTNLQKKIPFTAQKTANGIEHKTFN